MSGGNPGRYDALIIGAGPAGSAAAIQLAERGWSVALVERERFPRRKVCGECIAATNFSLLQALGVGESVRTHAGAPLRRVAVWAGEQSIIAPLPALAGAREAYARALGRERLDALLLERARAVGALVWQPWCAQRLRGGPGAWECELREGPAGGPTVRLRAAVAIAAYGCWRAEAGTTASPGRVRGALLGFKANFVGVRLAADLLPVLCFPGGYGGIVVADDGIATLACCIRADRLARSRSGTGLRAGEAVESTLRAHCEPLAQALADAERRGPWLAVGPLRPGVHLAASTAAEPGLFRIGNAAGEAHPIIGEGISMALQSAGLLCSLLLACPQVLQTSAQSASAQRQLAERYAHHWRRQFVPRLRWAACLAHTAMRAPLTGALLPLLRSRPGLLTRFARGSGKVRALMLPPAIAFKGALASTSLSGTSITNGGS